MRRLRFAVLAGLIGVIFLPCFFLLAWRFPFADGIAFADTLALLGALMGGGFALVLGGIALRNPVGLRLDRDGLSGYAAPAPLRWSDIADLQLVQVGRATAIAIWLHDPAAYRASLNPWQRLMQSGQINGAHASINALGLDMSPRDVHAAMRRFWDRQRD
jgi:hypothetical protein